MNPPHRPRKYADPIEFEERVEAYFADCDRRGKAPNIAGLAYFLGFQDRNEVAQYAEYEGFSGTAKRARLRIENHRCENLVDRATFTTGQIFDLKCNFGYREQPEVPADGFVEFGRAVAAALKNADRATAAQAAPPPETDDDDL